ncbi:MAG: branched-chain amino acid ABC transporter permease [Hyphomicrobiales bacterium]
MPSVWSDAREAARRLRASSWDRVPHGLHSLIWFVLALAVLVMPWFDDIWMRMFFLVALYVTLGMGLNVVVGLAGLLDLGFVAFFATGAYVVAIFGSPVSPSVDGIVNYWVLLPLAVGIGAFVGIALGMPVLPLRGDYLAIVTLGFGEIIRILLLNMDNFTRGSSGLYGIEKPAVGDLRIDNVEKFYFMIVIAAFLVWFASSRLRDSRVGRAWEAIREDEDVAAGMGVNTVRYKLMAFAIGASIGALGGAIYAPFIDFVAPQSFSLLVSINVLAIVIIGGMGSTQGVIAGSLILIGVPEILQFKETADLLAKLGWLRDFLNTIIDGLNLIPVFDIDKLPPSAEWGEKIALYRFIVYGALLVLVMVLRPSGLFPSRRRELEFEHPTEAETAHGGGIS